MLRICLLALVVLLPNAAVAQELYQELQYTESARVIEVIDERTEALIGTDVTHSIQELRVEILSGNAVGTQVVFENDFVQLDIGDRFFIAHYKAIDGKEWYAITDVDRSRPLIVFVGLFMLAVILFGGWQGVRALLSLAASIYIVLYILVPQLLSGAPPVLTSIWVSLIILVFAMVFTHGFNKKTLAAFSGTAIALVITVLLAKLAVSVSHLSGFASDESVYLNLSTAGTLDLSGLLLGAIIIGVLGLLDDIAITQAQTVAELTESGLSRKEVMTRALRVGREHVGALVNTLALAYVGAALPLVLLFSLSNEGVLMLLNREIFAAEIIRTAVGSIGLVLAVPITTILAIAMFKKEPDSQA